MPSIIFALVGVIVFCESLGLGKTLIAGAFSLVMMTLPTIIRTTQECAQDRAAELPRGLPLPSRQASGT